MGRLHHTGRGNNPLMLERMLSPVLHQAARHGGVHILNVFSRRLRSDPPPPAPNVTCRRLREEELPARCKGEVCVGAFVDGELVGYAWYAYDDAPHVKGVRVRVPAHAIYRFKVYVLPAYRGRGVAPFLYAAADRLVARPGRTTVVTCVALQNLPSLAASRRSGETLLGWLGYWQSGERFSAARSPAVQSFGLEFYFARARERAGQADARTAGDHSRQTRHTPSLPRPATRAIAKGPGSLP
jgi:GNAT superfamily N-acetyltransferase